MLKAFEFAEEALKNAEVPVGCVFVSENERLVDKNDSAVLCGGRNHCNELKNATKHAEMVAIDRVLDLCEQKHVLPEIAFPTITVYVTVEPCIMCAWALYKLKVERIVFGCSNERFGGIKSVMTVPQFFESPTTTLLSGVLEDKAIDMLKSFYKQENLSAPEELRKRKGNKDDE